MLTLLEIVERVWCGCDITRSTNDYAQKSWIFVGPECLGSNFCNLNHSCFRESCALQEETSNQQPEL